MKAARCVPCIVNGTRLVTLVNLILGHPLRVRKAGNNTRARMLSTLATRRLPWQKIEFDVVSAAISSMAARFLLLRTSLPNRFITSLGDGMDEKFIAVGHRLTPVSLVELG